MARSGDVALENFRARARPEPIIRGDMKNVAAPNHGRSDGGTIAHVARNEREPRPGQMIVRAGRANQRPHGEAGADELAEHRRANKAACPRQQYMLTACHDEPVIFASRRGEVRPEFASSKLSNQSAARINNLLVSLVFEVRYEQAAYCGELRIRATGAAPFIPIDTGVQSYLSYTGSSRGNRSANLRRAGGRSKVYPKCRIYLWT